MKTSHHRGWPRACALLTIVAFLGSMAPVHAAESGSKPLTQEQLDQLVAPIALYPDSLVAQVLMAATYPLEVVEAARWVKANPDLEGDALQSALEKQSWEASVKSLAAFPQTLAMMNEKLDWTTQLGDAFLAQQADVMDAVQGLRERAHKAGNLESNEQQTVKVEDTPSGNQSQTIIIQPANPQIVYVPTYNPTVVYGAWPYPAYRPFYWYPPGYAYMSSAISFGMGMAVGSALWGGCNWGHSQVNINVNRYNSFNKTTINNTNWTHNSTHRRGVDYRNQDVRNRYGADQRRNQESRDAFRGRAEQGRQQIGQGNADRFKGRDGSGGGASGNRQSIRESSGGGREGRSGGGRDFGSGGGGRDFGSGGGGRSFGSGGGGRSFGSGGGDGGRGMRFGGGGGGGGRRGRR